MWLNALLLIAYDCLTHCCGLRVVCGGYEARLTEERLGICSPDASA
jgi:hypothetical protein